MSFESICCLNLLVLYPLYWVSWGGVQKKEVKKGKIVVTDVRVSTAACIWDIIINSIKSIAWITGNSTRICSLSFVVISVPNSYYMSSGIHIFCKAMSMALLVDNITVICICLSQTVLTFPYYSIFEWAGSKWQIDDYGPECGVWCAYRCYFEWLTEI